MYIVYIWLRFYGSASLLCNTTRSHCYRTGRVKLYQFTHYLPNFLRMVVYDPNMQQVYLT